MKPFFPRGAASLFQPEAAPRARLGRLALLALLVGVGAWGWQWLSTDEGGQPLAPSDEPSLIIQNLNPLQVRGSDGLPLWEISARRVTVAPDNSATLAAGVDRGVLFRDGKPLLRLSAPLVRLSNPSSDLEASGGVSATGPDGFSFHTARASWLNDLKQVRCPQGVTAWLRGLCFQTPQLVYEWNRGVLTCAQRVEVRGQGFVIRGAKLEATLKTRQIKQSGGIEIIVAPGAVKKLSPE